MTQGSIGRTTEALSASGRNLIAFEVGSASGNHLESQEKNEGQERGREAEKPGLRHRASDYENVCTTFFESRCRKKHSHRRNLFSISSELPLVSGPPVSLSSIRNSHGHLDVSEATRVYEEQDEECILQHVFRSAAFSVPSLLERLPLDTEVEDSERGAFQEGPNGGWIMWTNRPGLMGELSSCQEQGKVSKYESKTKKSETGKMLLKTDGGSGKRVGDDWVTRVQSDD
ncbi:hypothetical protein FB451DRAFT_1192189 [Mycena latifolia]|nr:hypothetical protein FB451DRAFT_1192189 [Mycena latifolia]